MTQSRTFTAAAVAVGASLLFSMQASAARGPFARSLNQVDAIWLNSNYCANGLSEELADRGFMPTDSRRSADAVLDVSMNSRDSQMGVSASYRATLRGADGRVLFSTAGHETSVTVVELCSDISDDIFDRLESRVS